MADAKTRANSASVAAFLKSIEDRQRRADVKKIAAMMRSATGCRARMWGDSIVGYGSYRFRYASGRTGDWMLVGLSPRKRSISVYIMPGFSHFRSLLTRLGTYKTGRSCLTIKSLDDIDASVLEQLIDGSVQLMREKYDTR